MRHVDDAHLAEDDRKTERHQHVDRKQDQAREALHHEDRAQITNRVIAEHQTCPMSSENMNPRTGLARKPASREGVDRMVHASGLEVGATASGAPPPTKHPY